MCFWKQNRRGSEPARISADQADPNGDQSAPSFIYKDEFPQTAEEKRRYIPLGIITVALLVAALYFCCLGRSPLFDPDEGRHAEVAREALVTGNWVTPTLNFEPYHHKPMPFYWLVAAGLSSFPTAPEFGARLPSALAAGAAVLGTAWWASRFWGPLVGFWAGVILATASGFVAVGRAVLVDMSFTWWVTASHLLLGWFALSAGGAVRWYLPWICVGLAMLLKGPAALLLLVGSALFYSALVGQWAWLRQLKPVRGLVLATAVASVWYLWAAVVAPEYVREFLWLHNMERFVTGRPGHPQNLLYYFYVLPAVFLPWTLWWPLAARPVFQDLVQGKRASLFCAAWALCVIGFFTLSKGKLPTYVLPAFPPLAALTAAGLVAFFRSEHFPGWAVRWVTGMHVALAVAAAATLVLGWPILRLLREPELAAAVACVAAVASAVLAASYWWCRGQCLPVARIASVAVAFGAAQLTFYAMAAPLLSARYSLHDAAQALHQLAPDTTLFTYDAGINSLLFYSGRAVKKLETSEQAAGVLAREEPTVLLTKRAHLDEVLCATGKPVTMIWSGERDKLLLANRASIVGDQNGWKVLSGCARSANKAAFAP